MMGEGVTAGGEAMRATGVRPDRTAPAPAVPLASCPIEASLGTVGRRWGIVVLRDIAFFPGVSFSEILKRNQGLVPRTLSLRLKQLARDGLIERLPSATSRRVRYELTNKGRDVMPVLTALIQFGIRYHADRVFEDGRPRSLDEVYPVGRDVLLGQLAAYARASEPAGAQVKGRRSTASPGQEPIRKPPSRGYQGSTPPQPWPGFRSHLPRFTTFDTSSTSVQLAFAGLAAPSFAFRTP
jgi:DNA-binding HxlR family transcriptional regulator